MKRTHSCLVAVVIAAAACSSNQLDPAQIDNIVDTLSLAALTGTSITSASAYSIPDARVIRTDQTSAFDFAYDLQDGGRHVLLPLEALGLAGSASSNPGLIRSSETFAGLTTPPTNGYLTKDTMVVAVGDVVVARSRVACYLGVPEYAKLQILAFDDTKRTMQMQVLANVNCGYRNLGIGIPTS